MVGLGLVSTGFGFSCLTVGTSGGNDFGCKNGGVRSGVVSGVGKTVLASDSPSRTICSDDGSVLADDDDGVSVLGRQSDLFSALEGGVNTPKLLCVTSSTAGRSSLLMFVLSDRIGFSTDGIAISKVDTSRATDPGSGILSLRRAGVSSRKSHFGVDGSLNERCVRGETISAGEGSGVK